MIEKFERYRGAVLVSLAFVIIAALFAISISYFIYPGYVDHGEPSVAQISWRLLEGFAAYPSFDDPHRTINVYGPFSYIPHAIAFALAGSSVATGKAASLVAALLIPLVVFGQWRKEGPLIGMAGAIFAAGYIFLNVPTSLWNRPDSFIALLAVAAVWVMRSGAPNKVEWGKSIVIAVLAGIAVNMKIHAGVYFAPIVLCHCANRRLLTFLVMSGVGLAVAFGPFLFDVFSFSNYSTWFTLALEKSNPMIFLVKISKYSLFYLMPLLLYVLAVRNVNLSRENHVYALTYGACVLLVFFPASKIGAGTHYFYPFLAVSVDLTLRHAKNIAVKKHYIWGAVAVIIALPLIISIPVQKRFYRALHWDVATKISSEIRQIMAAYPNRTIEMGVGSSIKNYPDTFYKTPLVLAGNPYTIDGAVVTETSHMKIPLPDATFELIKSCKTNLWLIPKGEKPFNMIGYYGNLVFTNRFRTMFLKSHAKVKSFSFFDIWKCEPS